MFHHHSVNGASYYGGKNLNLFLIIEAPCMEIFLTFAVYLILHDVNLKKHRIRLK